MSNTETTPKVDLKSFFDLQKRYLQGTLQKSDDAELNKQITELQTELDTLNDSYDTSNLSNADLLTKQQQVHHILDEEKKRLEKQKSVVENNYVAKEREMQFNNSYRLRQHEVNKMLAVVVFGLFLIIVLILINRRFSFIPESAMTIALIVIISLVGIYCLRQIFKILMRSHMDFTKIVTEEPDELKKQSAGMDDSDLLAANELEYCVGPACCNDDTTFDNDLMLCVPKTEADATEDTEETTETFRNLQPSMCNTAYEGNNYAKI
jgi:hypothetical protein